MPAELRSGDGTTYPASMCGAVLSKVVYSHPVHLFSIIPVSFEHECFYCYRMSSLTNGNAALLTSVRSEGYSSLSKGQFVRLGIVPKILL